MVFLTRAGCVRIINIIIIIIIGEIIIHIRCMLHRHNHRMYHHHYHDRRCRRSLSCTHEWYLLKELQTQKTKIILEIENADNHENLLLRQQWSNNSKSGNNK